MTLGGLLFDTLSHFLKKRPPEARVRFLKNIGRLYGVFPNEQKKALQQNLSRLLAIKGNDLDHMTRAVFQNFTLTLHDFFMPEGTTLEIPDRAKIQALRSRTGGFLTLTFHMGNWEMGARVMKEWGWPVTAVYQPYENKKMKEVIEKRRSEGVNFVPVGKQAAQGVQAALRRGDVVAMLGDHPFGEEGIWVDLLNHKVRWPKGPVVLAAREKVPILVAVIIRTGFRSYTAFLEDPIYPTDRGKTDIEEMTQKVAGIFGKYLLRYPTQWYRFRPFEFQKEGETRPKIKAPEEKREEISIPAP